MPLKTSTLLYLAMPMGNNVGNSWTMPVTHQRTVLWSLYKSALRLQSLTLLVGCHEGHPACCPGKRPLNGCSSSISIQICLQCFDTGWASGRASRCEKSWVMRCYCGYLSGARCRWWCSWCHCHPVISCLIKIQIGLTFPVRAYLSCPGKEAIKWLAGTTN